MKNKELIRKWLNGEISSTEMTVLEKLPEYQEYQKIIETSSRFHKPSFDEAKHLHLLKERMRRSKGAKYRVVSLPALLKIAAVLLVLFASGWFAHYYTARTIQTEFGEMAFLELPDNSEVRLNAQSSISYNPSQWSDNRKLTLDGEAFFEVEHGREFTVETGHGTVRVIGTSFNVKSRTGYFEVTCFEGSVAVFHGDRTQILSYNEFYKSIEGDVETGNTEVDVVPGWMLKESRFRAVPLKYVLAEIERQFGIEIRADNVDGEQLFTGSFNHSDKEIALKSVTIPLGLEYRITAGNKVVLYEE